MHRSALRQYVQHMLGAQAASSVQGRIQTMPARTWSNVAARRMLAANGRVAAAPAAPAAQPTAARIHPTHRSASSIGPQSRGSAAMLRQTHDLWALNLLRAVLLWTQRLRHAPSEAGTPLRWGIMACNQGGLVEPHFLSVLCVRLPTRPSSTLYSHLTVAPFLLVHQHPSLMQTEASSAEALCTTVPARCSSSP